MKRYTELYVMMLDGAILTPDVFSQYWENYGAGGSTLQGWRPPKKIYYTLPTAKAQMRWIPEQIRSKVQIHRFVSAGAILDLNPKKK
jgi:hypothetical protein